MALPFVDFTVITATIMSKYHTLHALIRASNISLNFKGPFQFQITVIKIMQFFSRDRRWKIKFCRYSICRAQSMKILTPVNPESDKIRVVGIVSSQGCSKTKYTTSLSSTDDVTETYSISDTHGKSFEMGTEISVSAEASVKFLGSGGSVSVGVAQSFGETSEYSKTLTKETSTGHSTSAGQSMEFTGPGAAIIMAHVRQYKFKKSKLAVEYDIKCDDGKTFKEKSTVSLTAETYGRTHFRQRFAKFITAGKCTSQTSDCIDNIRGEKALSPEKIFADFNSCLRGKARISK